MALPFTNADALRSYLTGAVSDGASQPDADLSLGGFRAAEESDSLAIEIEGAIKGVVIQHASPSNAVGYGALISQDGVSLRWMPQDAVAPGLPVVFQPGVSQVRIIEGEDRTQFVRVLGMAPFALGTAIVTLTEVLENVYGLDLVYDADAAAGISQYRGAILKNVSNSDVTLIRRWIGQLGTARVSDQAQLGASGAGTIRSSQTLANWPSSGWCQIRDAGALREIVYYTSRTVYELTVPAVGRALLGTAADAGTNTDTIHAVPGIAMAWSTDGLQAHGAAMATIANDTTAPAGVTWNSEIVNTLGLQIVRMAPGQQMGFWLWRHVPAGAIFYPNVYNRILTSFVVN